MIDRFLRRSGSLRDRRQMLLGMAALLGVASWPHAHAASKGTSSRVDQEGAGNAAECIIPSKAGGGFELTCFIARDGLQLVRKHEAPLQPTYLPGGIGAMAYQRIVSNAIGGDSTVVAFSSGSLLNLAQGRFGPPGEPVQWLAALGADYGLIAVHRDSPLRSMADLLAAIRDDLRQVVFGAGGTVGSQDWVKAALIVRAAGLDHKAMRFVSFEGGGDALAALSGGHIKVFTGDAAEAMLALNDGASLRPLAVLAERRLPGRWSRTPTAVEQGVDLVWRTVRGLYSGGRISSEAVARWRAALAEMLAHPAYPAIRDRYGLFEFSLTGAELEKFVDTSLDEYSRLAQDLGLQRWLAR
ncbi:MAG: hypothetical protein GAK30_00525 [Paracidovorax wautersii]|uniref:Tricarboxylic transport membrane protein n=1 Tax=Paracidovorax wautersii TaxID=1177982 RepID=A0A7V8JRT3_9BURK|nr:MAG: hypothetical protein GAK30_00525 [Paracidovorax wautersii]